MFNSTEKLKEEHKREIANIHQAHEFKLRELNWLLDNSQEGEILNLKQGIVNADKEIASLQMENKMLREITDLNGDIVDIKGLVSNLISKLPEIKINSLMLQNTDGGRTDV